MDTEQHHDQTGKALYDDVSYTDSGAAFYSLYSQDGLFCVKTLVLEDGKICEGTRYQVNNDMFPYPAALAGDHQDSFVPVELEARAAKLTAALEATAPRQRTALSRDQSAKSASRSWRDRPRKVSRGRTF